MEFAARAHGLMGRRGMAALGLLAAAGLAAGYGVATRARAKPLRIPLSSSAPSRRAAGSVGGIYVHVAGAVARPGLYRVRDGGRVADAVEAAGGARADADLDALNLAARLRDGDKVLVPSRNPSPAPAGGSASAGGAASNGTVNINTAGEAELDSLPGIGPGLAQRILDYRQQHGPFRSPDDLTKVPGIGPKKFADLKDKVAV